MKHHIRDPWKNRLPVSVHVHTPFHRKRKRFLACARNDTRGRIAPHSFSHRRIDWYLSETLYPTPSPEGCFSPCEPPLAHVRLSLLSYRHPERSRGIFVATAILFPVLIRLHETPYPPMLGEDSLPVSVHTHTPFDRERKRFLAHARNDGTGKRYSCIASFPMQKGFSAGIRLSLLPMEGGAPKGRRLAHAEE